MGWRWDIAGDAGAASANWRRLAVIDLSIKTGALKEVCRIVWTWYAAVVNRSVR